MDNGKYPNTFLIGAPKCGTTAIAHYLSEHNDVFLGYPKEPSYWSSDIATGSGVVKLESFADYAEIYSPHESQKIVLDASTSYLYSSVAIKKILSFNPESKFIVILRNPVDMVHAYHMEKCFNAIESERNFQKAWGLQALRLKGRLLPKNCPEPKELQYKMVASLGTQLARVKSLVRDDRLLVMHYEDFRESPRTFWLSILHFLGIDDDDRIHFPIVGGAHQNKFPSLAKIYQQPPKLISPLVRKVKRTIRAGSNRKIEKLIKQLLIRNDSREPLDDQFKEELRKAFEEETKLIYELTGDPRYGGQG